MLTQKVVTLYNCVLSVPLYYLYKDLKLDLTDEENVCISFNDAHYRGIRNPKFSNLNNILASTPDLY